jgi:hypothetical protein
MPKKTVRRGQTEEVSRPYQVFISHATADKWLATTICEKIEACGATTFRDDRDINGGDDIPEEIRRQIEQSDEFLVLLTPESANRPWVLLEVGAAWGMRPRKRIVAILCHTSVDTIPGMIRDKKAYWLNEFDHYLDEVRGRARGKHAET